MCCRVLAVINHEAAVISEALGPIRLVQHPDEGGFVLVDCVHQLRMFLAKAKQQWLESVRVRLDQISDLLKFLVVSQKGQGIFFWGKY